VTRVTARRLFLALQGLTGPLPRASVEGVYSTCKQLGFVQVDSINVVERAHHLILGARLRDYRPSLLTPLLEKDRRLFEHWTHDASVIPTRWFPHWHHRFARYRVRMHRKGWWKERLGARPERVLARVRERLRDEGPLRAQAFVNPDRSRVKEVGWWGWSREKSALEYLWLTGEVAISGRVNFHKLYDLAERVLPEVTALPPSSEEDHLDWACTEALQRLGVASADELAAYFAAVGINEARAWAERASREGRVATVALEPEDGKRARVAYALPDWQKRAEELTSFDRRIRLLCPFDPILRDRKRTLRLFTFDFRFEAFVPAAQRRHGYYTMAILEGENLIGRFDPKLDRKSGTLEIRGLCWEPRVRESARRTSAFETAVDRLARALGAEHWSLA
jgi:uncharacterized protein YcaQ